MMQHIAAGCQCVLAAVRPTHLPRRRSRHPAAAQSFPAERAGRPPLHSRHVSGGQWMACTLQATSRCSFPILRGSTQGRPGAALPVPPPARAVQASPNTARRSSEAGVPTTQRKQRHWNGVALLLGAAPPSLPWLLAAAPCWASASPSSWHARCSLRACCRHLQVCRGGGGARLLCLNWTQAQRSGPRAALRVPAAHLHSATARSAVAGPRSSLVQSWVELLNR